MSAHALLSLLKANKPAFGAWLTASGYFHARTVAQASPHLSWIAIDCEHGLVSLNPGASESVAAIQSLNRPSCPSALVRIPATGASTGTSWQIKYALDAGARGVIVPMARLFILPSSFSDLVTKVSTAAKAAEVVSDSRFPPVGRRGFGNPHTHHTWGISANEYLGSANDSILVLVQIETAEGVKNVREIAAVDGVGKSPNLEG
jgi:4-hydroxy-2-oxoheptanedioate aldolase